MPRGSAGIRVTAAARAGLDAAVRRSPPQVWFRRKAAGSLAVLAYHGVDDSERFALHLDRICRTAHPVSLEDVVGAVAGRRPLPARSVLVTFDDGHRSVLEDGLPLLRRRGIPAASFVVAGLIGTENPYWWTQVEHLLGRGGTAPGLAGCRPAEAVRRLKQVPDAERRRAIEDLRSTATPPPPRQRQLCGAELRQLEAGGVEVGNHTLGHPCLDRCDDATVQAEIREAHDALAAALGRPPRAFAYPNGNWDPRAEAALRELGYLLGFLFDHRLGPPVPAHPLRVSRLRVNSHTSPDRFAAILSGLHPALHHARGRP